MEIHELISAQRTFYESGKTRSTAFRKAMLTRLRQALKDYDAQIGAALKADLNKDPYETYFCETGLVLEEIAYHLRHLSRWNRVRRAKASLGQLPGRARIYPEPYGVALIMAPWNYPVQLCLMPLVGAISGGNCAVVKPSAYAPKTSHVLCRMIEEVFPAEYIAVVEGGRQENQKLLDETFDRIFFTGSVEVGRYVMERASRMLAPVTLELGGKSPAIVDETADLSLAARRIAFGKVLNAGQTCVAPDYLLIDRRVESVFLEEYQKALTSFFPDGDLSRMVHIVNEKHFDRLCGLLADGKIAIGGKTDRETRWIEPTVLTGVSPQAPVMQQEIFGPILPVIPFDRLDEAIEFIRERPRPLALYLFSRSRAARDRVFGACSFGGGCLNDTILHLAGTGMGFGGVGNSGMGSYHGKRSFEAFTHERSILLQSNRADVPLRYFPYDEKKDRLVRKLLK